jgi:cytochrome c oxidase subunit 1
MTSASPPVASRDAPPRSDAAAPVRSSYLDSEMTLRSWLLTHDHKRIAILYALSITALFFVGGAGSSSPHPSATW